jgi:hypothetical protein
MKLMTSAMSPVYKDKKLDLVILTFEVVRIKKHQQIHFKVLCYSKMVLVSLKL